VAHFKQDVRMRSDDERPVNLRWLASAMALVHWKKVWDYQEKREKIARYGWRKITRRRYRESFTWRFNCWKEKSPLGCCWSNSR